MKKLTFLFFAIPMFLFSSALAGEIANVFSNSIFDLKWFSTIEEVKQNYPGGLLKTEYGVTSYRIYDGRTVLTIKRDSSNYIDFWFNSENQLNFVSVQFPTTNPDNLNLILTKLTTHFGPQRDNAKAAGNTLVIQWPKDEGFMINLTNTINMLDDDELVFNVGYTKPVTADKAKLGF